jgi:outer membrane protein OmpA-like peptidoglycan-associated protein
MKYLFFLLISLNTGVFAADTNYSGPDDPAAVLAAQTALKALGSCGKVRGHGLNPIGFSGRSIAIVGFEPVRFVGASEEVNRILRDMKAESMGTEVRVTLEGDVLFQFNKAEIRPEAEKALEKLDKAIGTIAHHKIIIEGHTDSVGTEAYNRTLSLKRAESVKQWFLAHSKNTKSIVFETRGLGEKDPVAPNTLEDGSDYPEGRAKNRRVDIRIM